MKNIFFRDYNPRARLPKRVLFINLLAVSIVLCAFLLFAFSRFQYEFRWDTVIPYYKLFIRGFLMTIVIALSSLVVSLIIGVVFALLQHQRFLPLRLLSRFYIELIRGTPLLVQILIFFYVIADAFHLQNRYVAGVLIMAIFEGAYITEIIRSGIDSIGRTQWEAARSLGFSKFQIYRYVVFPQVFRRILPPLTGQLASLIKDSSLLSVISVRELTTNAQMVNSYTFSTLESYIPLALAYLVLSFPVSLFSKHLERRFTYDS